MSKWIIARFPTPDTLDVMEAFCIRLLKRLSYSLVSAEEVLAAEHRNELREIRKEVSLSLNVLKELGSCADRTSVGVNMSPVSRKKPKAPAKRIGDILPRLQSILGVRVSPPLRLVSKYLPGFSTICSP